MKQRLLSVILCVMMVFTVVAPVTVMAEDYSDYVPGEVTGNMLAYPANINQYTTSNGTGGDMYRGSGNSLDAQKVYGFLEKTGAASSYFTAGPCYMSTADGNKRLTTPIVSGTTYAVSVRLRNGAPEKKETLKAAISYSTGLQPAVRWDVTSDEFVTYTGVFTATKDATSIGLGFDATVNRSAVTDADRGMLLLDYSSAYTYIGEEYAYDLVAYADNENIEAGETVTVNAEVVNQVGIQGSLEQNIEFMVLNEGRTQEITEGITLTDNGNGEATVEVADTVASGRYVILAVSNDYDGFRKGVVITVENQKVIEDTIEAIKGEDADTLAGNLASYLNILSIDDETVTKADVTELAKIIAGGIADEEISDREDMEEYIVRASVVALYNEPSDEIELYDANGEFIYEDILKLEDAIAYEVKDYVTDEGMVLVQEALTQKGYTSYAEFTKAVASELILKAISNSTEDGIEYLGEVLTAQNLAYIEVEADAFLNLNNNIQFLRDEIKGKEFTLETLEAMLTSAYESDMAALNADYVPGEVKGSLFVKTLSNNINLYTPNNGTGGTMYRGEGNSLDKEKMYGFLEKTDGKSSYFTAGPVYLTVSNERIAEPIVQGKTYAVAVRLKNGAPEKKATLKAAVAYGTGVAPAVSWDVSSSEFVTYTGVFTATKDATSVSLGFDATVDRSAVTDEDRGFLLLDYSAPYTYVGEEYLYDLTLSADTLKVEAGTSLNLTANAVNQVGMAFSSKAPSFNYYALNEERSESASGFAFVTSNNTKTAAVEVDVNTQPGYYTLMVEETTLGVEGFKKGIIIEVTKPVIRDTESGAKNITIDVTEGDTTVGVFDETVFTADVTDALGSSIAGTYEFDWYVLNEERTDIIEDGFVLGVSQDTRKLTLALSADVPEGAYYVVAEADGIRKSVALTVDKTNDIAVIIDNITNKPDKFKEDIETVVSLIELGGTYAQSADMAELADIIVAGADKESLTDKATLTEYIKRAAVVALYNKPSDKVELADENGNFKFASELKLEAIDTNGVTLYAGAMSELSKAGKKALQTALTGNDYSTCEKFTEALCQNLILVTIANPKDEGIAYLNTILTKKNLEKAGIDAGALFTLDDASDFLANEIAKKTFTVETLEKALDDAYETEDTEDDDDDDDNRGGSKVSFGGGGGGGSVSAGNKEEKKEPATAGTEFTDVPKTHWAYSDIHYLRDIGVINGVTEDCYNPDATVTREQFLKILMEAFNISTTSSGKDFADVDNSAWYAPYVNGGVANGIINGKSATEFGVGSAVTRQDACVMIDRVLGLSGNISEEIGFADKNEIADYAVKSVAALSGYGIVNGVGNNAFNPGGVCTRAQAAKIISQALSISNSLNLNGR